MIGLHRATVLTINAVFYSAKEGIQNARDIPKRALLQAAYFQSMRCQTIEPKNVPRAECSVYLGLISECRRYQFFWRRSSIPACATSLFKPGKRLMASNSIAVYFTAFKHVIPGHLLTASEPEAVAKVCQKL